MEGLKQVKDGVLLEVRAKPNSNQTRLYKKEEKIVLELQSTPEDNKANIEAIKYLKKLFGCETRLVSGLKSKNKIFLINSNKIVIEENLKAL